MSLLKKFAVAATLTLTLLAGCGQPVTELCPSDGSGPGQTAYHRIFNDAGAPIQKICHVIGGDLQQGNRYEMADGLLVIHGDVPAADIDVLSGKLFVTGALQNGAKVKAHVPENIRTDTSQYIGISMIGKSTILIPKTESHYVFLGYTYTDSDPAIIVGGDIGEHAELTSNRDFNIAGQIAPSAKFYNNRQAHNGRIDRLPVNGFYVSPLAMPAATM